MKFAAAALFIGAVAAGGYGGNGTWGEVIVTDVVTSFTTYCPEATTFVHGESTYTVTEVCDTPLHCTSENASDSIKGHYPHHHELPVHSYPYDVS